MKLQLVKATTSQTVLVFIQDSSSSVGAGLTGLAFGSAGLSWYYYRENAGTGATQVTLATMTIGTWATGGFIELDATDMPGWYELGLPNAALATSADFVGMQLKGATNMAQLNIEIQLTSLDLNIASVAQTENNATKLSTLLNRIVGTLAAGTHNAQSADNDVKISLIPTTAMRGTDGALTTKTGFSLSATGLDLVLATATGMVAMAKAVWDRVLSAANHNVPNSAGRRVRGLQDFGNYLGQIHVNTVNGAAGTVVDENGTLENPVSNWADALTLNAALNYDSFSVKSRSVILLTADSTGFVITGNNWELQWGGQIVTAMVIAGANKISGTCTDGAVRPRLFDCTIYDVTMPPFEGTQCKLKGAIIANAIGDYALIRCESVIAGAVTPSFDFGAALGNVNLTMPGYAQGIELKNFNATGTDLFSISGQGQIIYAASCSGTVNQRGDWKVTNTGGVTIISDDNTENVELILIDTDDLQTNQGNWLTATGFNIGKSGYSLSATGLNAIASTATGMVAMAKAVWDRVISKANHDTPQSAGKVLRGAGSFVIRENTAQGPGTGNNQIQFDTGASATDGAYDPSRVVIVGGTGAGQSRNILQYDGASKTATVDRNWKMTPDATSEYLILSDAGREHVNEGLAQAGSSNTITLNALASSDNDAYPGQIVFIRSGTGDDQAKLVLSYNGATKVATIDGTWGVNPDATSGYVMLPSSPVSLSSATQASIDTIEAAAPLSAAGIRTALGLASANLDTQFLASVTATGFAVAGDQMNLVGNALTAAKIAANALNGKGDWNINKTGYSMTGSISTLDGLANLTAAQVNTEILDVLTVDTFAELGTVPAATSSILGKLTWVFMLARNEGLQTENLKTLRNDADSSDVATSVVSSDGTTFRREKYL